jgi:hypothetical protein
MTNVSIGNEKRAQRSIIASIVSQAMVRANEKEEKLAAEKRVQFHFSLILIDLYDLVRVSLCADDRDGIVNLWVEGKRES